MKTTKIRKIILEQEEPFIDYDILCTLMEMGENNWKKILEILNQLIKENLVYYGQILNLKQGDCGFAFYTEKYKKLQIKKNLIAILNDKYDLDEEEFNKTYEVLIDLYQKGFISFNDECYKNKELILKYY